MHSAQIVAKCIKESQKSRGLFLGCRSARARGIATLHRHALPRKCSKRLEISQTSQKFYASGLVDFECSGRVSDGWSRGDWMISRGFGRGTSTGEREFVEHLDLLCQYGTQSDASQTLSLRFPSVMSWDYLLCQYGTQTHDIEC